MFAGGLHLPHPADRARDHLDLDWSSLATLFIWVSLAGPAPLHLVCQRQPCLLSKTLLRVKVHNIGRVSRSLFRIWHSSRPALESLGPGVGDCSLGLSEFFLLLFAFLPSGFLCPASGVGSFLTLGGLKATSAPESSTQLLTAQPPVASPTPRTLWGKGPWHVTDPAERVVEENLPGAVTDPKCEVGH